MNDLEVAFFFFVYIMIELTILFLAITFMVGIIREYVPPDKIRNALTRKRQGMGNIIGAGFGAVTPFCSCSTIPILMGMVDSGVPFGICMSFLIASPLLNPVIIGLLLTVMSIELVTVYFIVTFFGSVAIGILLQRIGLEKEVKDVSVIYESERSIESPNCNCGFWERNSPKIERAGWFSIGLFRHMFLYLLIGAAIGAFIYGFIPQDLITQIAGPDNPLAIPVAAVIGIPMYVRAETIIPIGIALISKGMSAGAVTALLIGGAGASIPEVIMLGGIFKRKLLIAFVLTILSVAILTGFMVELVGMT